LERRAKYFGCVTKVTYYRSTPLLTKRSLLFTIGFFYNFPNFYQSWFVGLDLGRGGLKKGKIVVITLTSPDGTLQAYWRAVKNEDDTLSPRILEEGLLLTALCHSATLSYQPSRLPAPLQWANGLARLSYEDLQFSGWSHKPSKLLTLADW
jgi:hypothetical protein